MKTKLDKYYKDFVEAYKKAYSHLSKEECQREYNKEWAKYKPDLLEGKEVDFKRKILDLKQKTANFKAKSTIEAFFNKPAKQRNSKDDEVPELQVVQPNEAIEDITVNEQQTQGSSKDSDDQLTGRKRKAPAQEIINEEISKVNAEIASCIQVRSSVGLSPTLSETLKKLQDKKKLLEKQLKKKISDMKSQAKARDKKTKVIQQLQKDHPSAASQLKKLELKKGQIGRPPLERSIIGLHEAILSIVEPDSAADERRRTETYNICKTLDSLQSKLADKGYVLTRTALYYRLMPANTRHKDGKRHVHTVPVKLCRPQNNQRKPHIDAHFAMASVRYARELAELFSDDHVFYLSQDDKARVPIGLPVSKKQDVMLMHLEYKVSLPDHDFPIGEKHKLIPSVYASCKRQKNNNSIGYSGPTYIAIRSGKHDKSCAASHHQDFETILSIEEFKSSCRDKDSQVKPLVFVSVDGGPDEAPKNQQSLASWSKVFLDNNLDALFVFTHAPGSSAYNQVERRMAPLSRDTAGLILPFDTYGSHLNASNKTTDIELEKRNFKAAGDILAEVWSETVIDGHPVVAEYKSPPDEPHQRLIFMKSELWKSKHVTQSQYMLQIVKCSDRICCGKWRTNYLDYFPQRFLPPPIPLSGSDEGLSVSDDGGRFGGLFQGLHLQKVKCLKCFDFHCPSVNIEDKNHQTKIQKRTCKYCSLYHSTIEATKTHQRVCKSHQNYIEESEDEEENESDIEMFEMSEPEEEETEISERVNIFEQINQVFGVSTL